MGKERQRRKNEETRQAILDTAIEISMVQGFEGLSIRKITDTLGYSAGIIYYYFPDKQAIIDAIHKEADTYIINEIKHTFSAGKGFEYNIRAVFDRVLQLAIEQPERYRLIAIDKFLKRNESIDVWISSIEEAVNAGISSGELRQIDARLTAFNVWTSFWGLIIMINRDKKIEKEHAVDLFNNQLDMIMNGMKRK